MQAMTGCLYLQQLWMEPDRLSDWAAFVVLACDVLGCGQSAPLGLLLVAEGAKDGVILVAGDVEVMKALPA